VSSIRRAVESPRVQGPGEKIAYSITTTPWGSTPSSVVVTIYDVTDPHAPADVTSGSTEASATVSGDVITTPRIKSLTLGKNYRMDVQFQDAASNTWVVECDLLCR
jgi:hypothetical protein